MQLKFLLLLAFVVASVVACPTPDGKDGAADDAAQKRSDEGRPLAVPDDISSAGEKRSDEKPPLEEPDENLDATKKSGETPPLPGPEQEEVQTEENQDKMDESEDENLAGNDSSKRSLLSGLVPKSLSGQKSPEEIKDKIIDEVKEALADLDEKDKTEALHGMITALELMDGGD